MLKRKEENAMNVSEVNINPSLIKAVRRGNLEQVKKLVSVHGLSHCGDARGSYAILCEAIKVGQGEVSKYFLQEEGAKLSKAPELLHLAITRGLVEVCEILIENGADINARNTRGDTPLHLTIPKEWDFYAYPKRNYNSEREEMKEARKLKIAKLLLTKGADVNVRGSDGFTAFHRAALNEKEEFVNIFLEFGIYVDLRAEDGSTPLHLAATRGYQEIVEVLCENHANVDACQNDGFTPLHCAVNLLDEEYVSILLDYGCDVNIETCNGETAIDIAISAIKSFVSQTNRQELRESRRDLMDELKYGKPPEDPDYESSSDIEDYLGDDFNIDAYLDVKTLKKHLIKLEAAGLYVSEKNLRLLSNVSSVYSDFKKKCKEEINRMRNEKLHRSFTVYNILASGNTPTYVRNKSLMKKLESFEFEDFPIYEGLLTKNFEKSKSRLQLLSSAQESLGALVNTNIKLSKPMPPEKLDQIVSYLNNGELKSLVCCGEILKRHQSQ